MVASEQLRLHLQRGRGRQVHKAEADLIAGVRGDDFPVPEDDIGTVLRVRRIVTVDDDNYARLKEYESRAADSSVTAPRQLAVTSEGK